jgi:hypothetical protein
MEMHVTIIDFLLLIFIILEKGNSFSGNINVTKLFLGAISCLFDLIFIVQHYILYPEAKNKIHKEDL